MRPYQLALDGTLGVVWVANINGEVQELSEVRDSVSQTIRLGGVAVDSIAVDPATSTVYAATPADGLVVINETSGVVGPYINIPAVAAAVDLGSGTVARRPAPARQARPGHRRQQQVRR
jgi:DNA-binding beta-propeller fold protein YncE